LLLDGLQALVCASERGTPIGTVPASQLQEFVKALKELELREVLHIFCHEMETVAHFARQLAPFETFPTKKVRFNVFPQSLEKLALVAKACGTKTQKSSMDTVLEFLFHGLPLHYWNRKADVAVLLSAHLPSTGHATPVSMAMNGLGYALLQDLAGLCRKLPKPGKFSLASH
jgi:hypothetical protein